MTPKGGTAIGDVPMAVLARRLSVVRDWVTDLPLQPSSARLLIVTVSAIFEAAVEDRIMARNPLKAKSVDKPDEISSEVVVWSSEQVEAVACVLLERMACMAWLGGVTGMRQGEMLGADARNIDWPRRQLRVEAQVVQVDGGLAFGPLKNRKPRVVPVPEHIMNLLSQHIAKFPPAVVTLPWSDKKDRKRDGRPVSRHLLFADTGGHAYYRQSVNREWRKAWTAAGIPDAGRHNGMHVLRHTAASHWLAGGLNPARVADYIGDTVAVLLSTYAHFVPGDDDRGRAIMDGFLNPGNTASGTSGRPHSALGGA